MSDVWVATNTQNGYSMLLHADLMKHGLVMYEDCTVLYLRLENPEGGPLTRLVECPSSPFARGVYPVGPPPLPPTFEVDLVEVIRRTRALVNDQEPVLIIRAELNDKRSWVWKVYRYETFIEHRGGATCRQGR